MTKIGLQFFTQGVWGNIIGWGDERPLDRMIELADKTRIRVRLVDLDTLAVLHEANKPPTHGRCTHCDTTMPLTELISYPDPAYDPEVGRLDTRFCRRCNAEFQAQSEWSHPFYWSYDKRTCPTCRENPCQCDAGMGEWS